MARQPEPTDGPIRQAVTQEISPGAGLGRPATATYDDHVPTNQDNPAAEPLVPPVPARGARLDWVDTGRGIAILLVALFHATNWLAAAGADVAGWAQFNLVVSSLRMPLFFALSGLFAAKWLRVGWGRLWQGKIRLFAWVFVVWSIIGACAFTLGTRVMLGQGSLVEGTIVPILTVAFRPRLELWFIWALALFFCLAKLTSRVDLRLQLGIAGVASALAFGAWVTSSPGWNGSVRYYFFFLAGLYGRELVLRLGATSNRVGLAAGVVAWLVVSLALWHWQLREVPGLYFVNCLLGIVAGIALSRAVSWALLRRIGTQTLPIYLAHTPVIMAVCMVVHVTGLDAVTPVMVVAPALLTAFAVATALWLNRVLPRHRLGWLYEPPAWFPGAPRVRAPDPEPEVRTAA